VCRSGAHTALIQLDSILAVLPAVGDAVAFEFQNFGSIAPAIRKGDDLVLQFKEVR